MSAHLTRTYADEGTRCLTDCLVNPNASGKRGYAVSVPDLYVFSGWASVPFGCSAVGNLRLHLPWSSEHCLRVLFVLVEEMGFLWTLHKRSISVGRKPIRRGRRLRLHRNSGGSNFVSRASPEMDAVQR